jgi:hypothetical protein
MAFPKAGLLFQHYLPETYKNKRYAWFYLIKHSIAHNIQLPVTGSLTNNSLSRMWKEAVVALFKKLFRHLPGGNEGNIFQLSARRTNCENTKQKTIYGSHYIMTFGSLS